MSKSLSCRSRFGPDRPDPWVHRKVAILIVFALLGWSFYVVAGRVCAPMIRSESDSRLGQSVGAGTLVGYVILWLLMTWSYLKMILTGPGFARKVIPKSPKPDPSLNPITYHPPPTQHTQRGQEDPAGPDPSEVAPVFNLVNATFRNPERASSSTTLATQAVQHKNDVPQNTGVRDWRAIPRPLPALDTQPRWCRFCEIIKPDRTHHCRHCGTCVLQFDHHCIWIGQCVGWANHKFFITFTFWSMAFCLYLLALLTAVAVRSSNTDGQIVALIAVAALFGLFTGAMFGTHVYLILHANTTVESYAARDQEEAEDRVLQEEYGYFFHNSERRKARKKWREDWGGTPVNGRWVFGTKRQLWEREMGLNPLGWILPIGRPLGDGIHFSQNPRFGPNGEWLMRKDWPKGLDARIED